MADEHDLHQPNESDSEDEQSDESSNASEMANLHQYLGKLEILRGREIFEDGSVQNIPLYADNHRLMLVQGQTIPLFPNDVDNVNVIKYAKSRNRMFGITNKNMYDFGGMSVEGVQGITAEICEYSAGMFGGSVKVKAIGRQRFQLLQVMSEVYNNTVIKIGVVRILPEIVLASYSKNVELPSLMRFKNNDKTKKRCLLYNQSQLNVPYWAYRRTDANYLKEVLRKICKEKYEFVDINWAEDATALSYKLVKSIPFLPVQLTHILKLPSTSHRLQYIISTIEYKAKKIMCSRCHIGIAKQKDIISMNGDGPQGTYVNGNGYIHELVTLRQIRNYTTDGFSSKDFSWFPGYKWSIIACSRCSGHLGWKFTATKSKRTPQEFFAVRNRAVNLDYAVTGPNPDDSD